jgi:hypothetical protein
VEPAGEFCEAADGFEHASRSLSRRRREPDPFSDRLSDFIDDHGLDACAADIHDQRSDRFMMQFHRPG